MHIGVKVAYKARNNNFNLSPLFLLPKLKRQILMLVQLIVSFVKEIAQFVSKTSLLFHVSYLNEYRSYCSKQSIIYYQ